MQKKTTTNHLSKKRFLEYAFAEAERMKQSSRIGVSKNYANSARQLQKYLATLGKRDVTFPRLHNRLMHDFEDWLHQNGVCRNTSSAYMRSLHAIHKRAAEQGFTTGNPFAGIYRGIAKTRKRAIPMADIRRISTFDVRTALSNKYKEENKKIHGRRFDKLVEKFEFFRDIFVFCFCARGMTFVDLAYLRKTDIAAGTITYNRRKTGQQLHVRIEPQMQRIIDRHPSSSGYLFHILNDGTDARRTYQVYISALSLYNKTLKQLGEMMSLPLTSYVSRHSWATAARQQNIPLHIISQSMGHNNEQTTEIYLKSIDDSQIDQSNRSLLDTVFVSE